MIVQGEAFVKAAISLIPDVPITISMFIVIYIVIYYIVIYIVVIYFIFIVIYSYCV